MIWLIFLILAALPSYLIRFKIGSIPTTILEVLILFTFMVWLAGKLRTRQLYAYFKNFPRLWLWIICLWLVSATISVFVSPNIRAALGIWRAYFVEPILFLFIFVDIIKARRDLHLIFVSLGLSAIYISLVAIAQRFFGWPIPTPWQTELRVISVFEYPNAVGLFLGPLIPIFIGELRMKNYELWGKIFFAFAAIISILAIILAKSEGAILGVAAGLFILGLLWSKRARITTVILSVLVLIVLLSTQITRNYLIEKSTLRDWSGLVRRITWKETWNMLRDRPILGAGLAGYQTTMIPYHKNTAIEIFLYPHNIFLNFWSELGLFGLAIFLLLIAIFFKQVLKLKSGVNGQISIVLISAVIALIMHGLLDVPYFKNDLSVVLWLLIGLSINIARNAEAI